MDAGNIRTTIKIQSKDAVTINVTCNIECVVYVECFHHHICPKATDDVQWLAVTAENSILSSGDNFRDRFLSQSGAE